MSDEMQQASIMDAPINTSICLDTFFLPKNTRTPPNWLGHFPRQYVAHRLTDRVGFEPNIQP